MFADDEWNRLRFPPADTGSYEKDGTVAAGVSPWIFEADAFPRHRNADDQVLRDRVGMPGTYVPRPIFIRHDAVRWSR